MHRWIRGWWLGLVVVLAGTGLHAQEREDGWQALMRLSGIEHVLRDMPAYFEDGMAQAQARGAQIPPDVQAALQQAARDTYRFEALRALVGAQLQASLSPAQRDEWLAFYRSPLGQKLTQADTRVASPAVQRELLARAPEVLEALGRDTARLALVQSWLQATQAVEHATQWALQMQMALEWGLISATPPAVGKPTFEELQAHFENQRFAVRGQVAQQLLASAALAYEPFSTEELSQLLRQANSPAGKALYGDFSRRLYHTMVVLAERIGQEAGRTLGRRPA